MQKILLPVDGSKPAPNAVAYVLNWSRQGLSLEVELINIQIPIVSGEVRRFVSQAMIDDYHRAEGEEALKAAKQTAGSSWCELQGNYFGWATSVKRSRPMKLLDRSA